jgi:LuxR family maltose regulon positive regulatory protein
VDQALAWAGSRGLSAEDELTYVREFEHLTLARALMTEGNRDADRSLGAALGLLGRLRRAAQDGRRNGSVIEIRVVEALAHHRRGDLPGALGSLAGALSLAEPEGYVRTFLDEGAPMAALLAAAADRGSVSPYLRRLRAGLGTAVSSPERTARAMVEPLSSRERDVLRLLGTDLTGPEIARELVVSLNTVRTHTKNLYMKLGVNDRRAAVRRAHDLDLDALQPTRGRRT